MSGVHLITHQFSYQEDPEKCENYKDCEPGSGGGDCCKFDQEIATPFFKGWKKCRWKCKGWPVDRFWPVEIPCPGDKGSGMKGVYPAPGWRLEPPTPTRNIGDPVPKAPIQWS